MTQFVEFTQPPPQEGMPASNITVVLAHLAFTFKQPLQPIFMVNVGGAIMPCIGDYDNVVVNLEKLGLKVLDTPEGTRAVVNPAHVMFYTSPELGVYSLMFPGKAGMTVRATTAEIEGLWKESSIVI